MRDETTCAPYGSLQSSMHVSRHHNVIYTLHQQPNPLHPCDPCCGLAQRCNISPALPSLSHSLLTLIFNFHIFHIFVLRLRETYTLPAPIRASYTLCVSFRPARLVVVVSHRDNRIPIATPRKYKYKWDFFQG